MTPTPSIHLALLEAAGDTLGIYPASNCGEPRTPWQDGWNAYALALHDAQAKAVQWFKSLPDSEAAIIAELLPEGELSIDIRDGMVSLWFNTSDLFAWGYANRDKVEDVTMLTALHVAWQDDHTNGMRKWWCKRCGMRPQKPIQKQWRDSGCWDAELEALPEPDGIP